MARYSDTQEISFDAFPQERAIVVSTGSVAVNIWDGTQFVASETLNAGASVLFTSGLRVQFVPSGSATYYIDESNRAS